MLSFFGEKCPLMRNCMGKNWKLVVEGRVFLGVRGKEGGNGVFDDGKSYRSSSVFVSRGQDCEV